jgi:hypothetical protein
MFIRLAINQIKIHSLKELLFVQKAVSLYNV